MSLFSVGDRVKVTQECNVIFVDADQNFASVDMGEGQVVDIDLSNITWVSSGISQDVPKGTAVIYEGTDPKLLGELGSITARLTDDIYEVTTRIRRVHVKRSDFRLWEPTEDMIQMWVSLESPIVELRIITEDGSFTHNGTNPNHWVNCLSKRPVEDALAFYEGYGWEIV